MKTKEFIKKVENLGYLVDDGYGYWQIWSAENPILAAVNKIDLSRISTDFVGWCNISDEDKSKLLDLIVEYANTPVEEREEEKKFYLKHRYFEIAGGGRGFFTIDNESGLPFLKYVTSSDNYNQIFTLNETEEIKEKFDTDLSDFELVEVEE